MYDNTSSPIMLIRGEAAKKLDRPQDLSRKQEAIEKVEKDLKKMGFFKTFR